MGKSYFQLFYFLSLVFKIYNLRKVVMLRHCVVFFLSESSSEELDLLRGVSPKAGCDARSVFKIAARNSTQGRTLSAPFLC